MNPKQILQHLAHYVFIFSPFDGHANVIVGAEASDRATTMPADNFFQLIETKSLAVDLQKPFQPSGNIEVAFVIAPSEVTGSQLTAKFVTFAKVTASLGITKHHVGSRVKQFSRLLAQRKPASGDR